MEIRRSETGKMVLMGLHAQEHLFPERMLYLLSMASVNPISGSSPRTWCWHESVRSKLPTQIAHPASRF